MNRTTGQNNRRKLRRRMRKEQARAGAERRARWQSPGKPRRLA